MKPNPSAAGATPGRAEPVDALILDLLEWLRAGPRPYAEVMERWRTSCPRLPVWEEANLRAYLTQSQVAGSAAQVALSAVGRAHLQTCRPTPSPCSP